MTHGNTQDLPCDPYDENTAQFNIAIAAENDDAQLYVQRIRNAGAGRMAIAIEDAKQLQELPSNEENEKSVAALQAC